MNAKKIIFLAAALAAAAILLRTALTRRAPSGAADGRIKVTATLFPLYDMARAVGGDRAEVSLLLPPGMEPHSFEPKAGDILRIDRADIFVYTGAYMEPWAEDLIKGVSNKNLVAVNAGLGARMEGGGGAVDPHIWLDPDNAVLMTDNIAAAFGVKDPAGAAQYRGAAEAYKKRLKALDAAYKAGLADCEARNIVYGGHYALGYLARRYGLNYVAAQGLAPDSEPTARGMAALVELVKRDRLKYIFYEELASPRIAETVRRETGAGMLPLSAAHNLSKEQLARGVSFFDILEDDLDNLKKGLGCR